MVPIPSQGPSGRVSKTRRELSPRLGRQEKLARREEEAKRDSRDRLLSLQWEFQGSELPEAAGSGLNRTRSVGLRSRQAPAMGATTEVLLRVCWRLAWCSGASFQERHPGTQWEPPAAPPLPCLICRPPQLPRSWPGPGASTPP